MPGDQRPAGTPRRLLLPTFALAILLWCVANVAAEHYLVSGGPSAWSTGGPGGVAEAAYMLRHFGGMLVFFVGIAASIVVSVAALGRFRRDRPTLPARVLVAALAPVLMIGAWYASERAAYQVRRQGLATAATRLTPLARSVERYARRHGTPPASLEAALTDVADLPDVLGPRGCRAPEYRAESGARDGAGWSLELDCPNGFLTLDRLVYSPMRDVPYAPATERFGAWVYVWD